MPASLHPAGWSDAGTAALVAVFTLSALSWAVPAARRRMPFWSTHRPSTVLRSRQVNRRYSWDRITGVRLYTVGWMEPDDRDDVYRRASLPAVGSARRRVRTETASARIDAAELARALGVAHPPPLTAVVARRMG